MTLSVSDTFSQFKLVKYSRAGTVYSFKWQTSQISDSPAWSLTCPDWGNLNQGPPAGASTTFLPPPSHCIMWGNTQDSLLAPSLFPSHLTLPSSYSALLGWGHLSDKRDLGVMKRLLNRCIKTPITGVYSKVCQHTWVDVTRSPSFTWPPVLRHLSTGV